MTLNPTLKVLSRSLSVRECHNERMPSHILNMTVKTVPITDVTPYPGNPRKGHTAVIASSLTEHGQYRPLVVQKATGHILAGNNTYEAARELAWKKIAVQYVDVDDERARKIVAVDNRSSDLASYDEHLLAEFLSELDETSDLTGTGYTDDDLDEIIGGLSDDDSEEETTFVFEAPATRLRDTIAQKEQKEEPAPPSSAPERPEPAGEPTNDDAPLPSRPDSSPHVEPVAEMILAFTPEDRSEVGRLITAVRDGLDPQLKNTDVILRALRTLVAAVDAKNSPQVQITVSELLLAAR